MRAPPFFYFCAVFPWRLARASTSVVSRGFMRPSEPLGFYADLNRKPTQGIALSICRPNSQDAFTRGPWLEQNKGLAQQTPLDPKAEVPSPPFLPPPQARANLMRTGLVSLRPGLQVAPLVQTIPQISDSVQRFASPHLCEINLPGEARHPIHPSPILSACCIWPPGDVLGLKRYVHFPAKGQTDTKY